MWKQQGADQITEHKGQGSGKQAREAAVRRPWWARGSDKARRCRIKTSIQYSSSVQIPVEPAAGRVGGHRQTALLSCLCIEVSDFSKRSYLTYIGQQTGKGVT